MPSHFTLGRNDLAKAQRFYDDVPGPVGSFAHTIARNHPPLAMRFETSALYIALAAGVCRPS